MSGEEDEELERALKPRFATHVLPWLALAVPLLVGAAPLAVGSRIDSDLRPFAMGGGALIVLWLQYAPISEMLSPSKVGGAAPAGGAVGLAARVLLSAALLAWAVGYVRVPGYERERYTPAEREEVPDTNPDNKEGGCPCGCDHSLAMAEELRAGGRDLAQVEIDRSLKIMGEREDAGYITEAMVEHRLRLLSLRQELAIADALPARGQSPLPELRSEHTSDTLEVHAELLVFGGTTELVRGKPKALQPTFLVRLLITNRTSEPLALALPALDANVPLPVRRWYLHGSDGAAWDGRLGPHETRSLHVIGYVIGELAPGRAVRGTLTVGDAMLSFDTLARGRWDEEPARSLAPPAALGNTVRERAHLR